MRLRPAAPAWGFDHPFLASLVMTVVCVLGAPASAQPKPRPAPTEPRPELKDAKLGKDGKDGKDPKTGKPKTFDFTALDLNGRMRSPQLLYFLERANEELERASLEKRSFIPHLVRSLEEEAL